MTSNGADVDPATEVFAEIVTIFVAGGFSRSDALRWLELNSSSTNWSTIENPELRQLAEKYRDATARQSR
jgi:hypothetical protein